MHGCACVSLAMRAPPPLECGHSTSNWSLLGSGSSRNNNECLGVSLVVMMVDSSTWTGFVRRTVLANKRNGGVFLGWQDWSDPCCNHDFDSSKVDW
jgi:hypothetical protein